MADPFAMRDRAASRAIQMQRLRLAAEAEARQQAMAQQGLAARQAEMQARQQGLQMQERQFGRAESNDQFRNEMAWRQYKQQQEQNKAQMASRAAESAERRATREAAEKKERMRLQGIHAQDLSNLEAINSSVQGLIGRMGSIQRPSNRGGFKGNFGMFPEAVTRYLPGENYDTKTELEQLEEMAKVSGLGSVRAQAGQSVGTITEREWPIMASQLMKLNVGQTDKAAEGMMGTARRNLLNMRNRELREYQNKWKGDPLYKDQPFSVPPVETQGKMAGIPKTFGHGQEIWDHLTPEEKALWLPGMEK